MSNASLVDRRTRRSTPVSGLQIARTAHTLGPTTLGDLTYSYDLAGQRVTMGGSWARTGLPSQLQSATYDGANRLTDWAGQVFSYDANGNLASDGLTSYLWNARNQLVGFSGAMSASFQYDGTGRRRNKITGGASTNFVVDGFNVVQELSGSTPTANLFNGLGMDEVFTRTDGSGTTTLVTDTLGSTFELADASGTLQTHYTYEPFGSTRTTGATSTNTQQFTGRENDDTALYFYRARYYIPSLQRFASEDPIAFAGGSLNLYTYAAANPLRFIDPTGLAYFAKRPLKGAALLSNCNPLDDYFNTETVHEQLFFEDGKKPANIGVFEDSTLREDNSPGPWRCKSGPFDDCIMRKAVANVGVPKPFCTIGPGKFNCQDWATAVREEYARLVKAGK